VREQPAHAAGVEAGQGDRSGVAQLVDEQPGDQESGQDEEDVDAHEAAGEPRHARVEGDHQQDGQPAQALDVRPERRSTGVVVRQVVIRQVVIRQSCAGAPGGRRRRLRCLPGQRAGRHLEPRTLGWGTERDNRL
jgi:hypothetical protein